MHFHTINTIADPFFHLGWNLYESSFPAIEKRTVEEQALTLQKEPYTFMTCHEESTFIGIITFWNIDGFTYIEHFAVNETLRGQNYGSKVLNHFIKKYKNIFLEIEPPICDISTRRLSFYKKLGFVQNDIKHFQAPFRKNDTPLQLDILSWNTPLDKQKYILIYEKMKKLLITI